MRSFRLIAATAALSMIFMVGCSQQRASNPSVKDGVEKSLEQDGFRGIRVDEDRKKGVVTLKGEVATQAQKERAEASAKAVAGNNIIANELLVIGGNEEKAADVAEATDDAIESSFKAMVTQNNWDKLDVRTEVNNGVVTLTGDVDTAARRSVIEAATAKLPGVKQVVNKLEVERKRR